jgi:raffinose/stachyose/melibiose transport system permease protein
MIRRIVVYLLLIIGCLVSIVPFAITTMASLKTMPEIVENVLAWPESPNWENYRQAWDQGGFDRLFYNSTVVALAVVVPSVLLSSMTGYAFARYRFRGSNALFGYMLLGMVVPLQALVVPLFYMMRELNLLDSLWALILPQIALSMSFGTLLMRQAFSSVPRDIVEASVLDGATSWQILWQVMFPLSRPLIGTLGLLFFIWTWNEFLLPLVVNIDPYYHTLPVGLLNFQGRWSANMPVMAAGATIIFLPLVVIFLVFQKQLIQGLTEGALKG